MAPPVYGARAAVTSRSRGDASSTREISLATARGSPSRARETSAETSPAPRRRVPPASGRNAPDRGVALPAATAEGSSTDATTAALQLEREVEHDPGTGHADRVAEGDRTAVHVDLG